MKNRTAYLNCDSAWNEQRQYNDLALDALGPDHPLTKRVLPEWAKLTPQKPDVSSLTPVTDLAQTFTCHGVTYGFDSSGAMSTFDTRSGTWASSESVLGKFVYSTYTNADFAGFPNAVLGGKPGSDPSTVSRDWYTTLSALWTNSGANTCQAVMKIVMSDPQTAVNFGAPQEIWVSVNVQDTQGGSTTVSYELQWFGKQSTRLAESFSFDFSPVPRASYQWTMDKIGTPVSPTDVIWGGSQLQHAVWDGVTYYGSANSSSMTLFSLDVPVVCPITAGLHATPLVPFVSPLPQQPTGFGFNLYNNVWNTK